MIHRKYTTNEFKDLRKQHNIMVLIGNGFDIDILTNFKQPNTTTYRNFYNFLRYRKISNDNSIFAAMRNSKHNNVTYWSDFERLLIELCDSPTPSWNDLEQDLYEIQKYFSMFLDDIIKPELLNQIGNIAQEKNASMALLSELLSDVSASDYGTLRFPSLTWHYDLYSFKFINFNYTYLFDNYIHLDKAQFNPQPYKTADRNFDFKPNPNSFASESHTFNKDTIFSSYIVSSMIHPHGVQSIPKSILFGFNDKHQVKVSSTDKSKRFTKTFWAQNDLYYKNLINDSILYVIFGLSCGKTDKWWWHEIVARLDSDEAELIIYHYQTDTNTSVEDVKEYFIETSEFALNSVQKARIFEKIFVVLHNETTDRKLFKLAP